MGRAGVVFRGWDFDVFRPLVEKLFEDLPRQRNIRREHRHREAEASTLRHGKWNGPSSAGIIADWLIKEWDARRFQLFQQRGMQIEILSCPEFDEGALGNAPASRFT